MVSEVVTSIEASKIASDDQPWAAPWPSTVSPSLQSNNKANCNSNNGNQHGDWATGENVPHGRSVR